MFGERVGHREYSTISGTVVGCLSFGFIKETRLVLLSMSGIVYVLHHAGRSLPRAIGEETKEIDLGEVVGVDRDIARVRLTGRAGPPQ